MSSTRGYPVPKPESIPGLSTLFDADGDNTAQVCSTTAGKLYALSVSNINAADAFIQLHDVVAGSVVVGTTTPLCSIHIPKGDATDAANTTIVFPIPIDFGTAITYVCTTTAAGSTDPAAGLVVNLFYAN